MNDQARPQRRFPAILLAVVMALFVGRIAVPRQEKATSGAPARGFRFAGDRIGWVAYDRASEISQSSGKPILYDFTAEWCKPCHEFSREVFADEKSAALINDRFVPVQVLDRRVEEGHNAPAVERLEERYEVNAFPTLVVAEANGTLVGRYRGFAGGPAGRAEVENFLRLALEKAKGK